MLIWLPWKKLTTPLEIKGQLADYYFDQKKFDQARTTMEEIFSENPKNGGANLVKAKFLIKEGDNQQALSILMEMVGRRSHRRSHTLWVLLVLLILLDFLPREIGEI